MYEDFTVNDRWTDEPLQCTWKGTVVAIATRHADATDVRFAVNGRALWIAMPNVAWVEMKRTKGHVITDYVAAQAAGRYLKQAIETGYDNGREMYTMTVDEVLEHADAVVREAGRTTNLPTPARDQRRHQAGKVPWRPARRSGQRDLLPDAGTGCKRSSEAMNGGGSRRSFLRRALGTVTALYASNAAFGQVRFFGRQVKKKASPAPQPLVYFGTDTTRPGAKGIYVSRFNSQTGQLSAPLLVAEAVRPSFMALNSARSRRILYAANEGNDDRTSKISAFSIDPASGALNLLGDVTSAGAGPCSVSVDATGSSVYGANYAGGTIASYKVQPDGSLSQPVSRVNFHGPPFPKPGPTSSVRMVRIHIAPPYRRPIGSLL